MKNQQKPNKTCWVWFKKNGFLNKWHQSTPWYCQSSRWWTDEREVLHRDTKSWRNSTVTLDATCHRGQETTGHVDDIAAGSLDTHRQTYRHIDR